MATQQALLYGVVLNVVLWCFLISFYFLTIAREQEAVEANPANVTALPLEVKVVWISGLDHDVSFDDDNYKEKRWIPLLPRLFLERYPTSRLIVTQLNLTRHVNHTTAEWIINEWKIIENSSNFEHVQYQSLEQLQNITPDIHFLDNTHKFGIYILRRSPRLFLSSVVRVIYTHSLFQLEYADLVVSPDTFMKPFPRWKIQYYNEAIARRRQFDPDENTQFSFEKENFIFFPATVSPKKGQLDFATLLDPDILSRHDLAIRFVGSILNNTYWEETKRVLTSKGVRFEHLGFVEDQRVLADLYVSARVIVHYPNAFIEGPSMVYEGLFGNTPFFVSDSVQLDPRIQSPGVIVERGCNESMVISNQTSSNESTITNTSESETGSYDSFSIDVAPPGYNESMGLFNDSTIAHRSNRSRQVFVDLRCYNRTLELINFNERLEYVLSHRWGGSPRYHAQRYLTPESFNSLFVKIDCALRAKQKIARDSNIAQAPTTTPPAASLTTS